jgi:AcrR family transcriptional regulator
MRVTHVEGDHDRSFTATARRAQIVAATIETIAELGYGQASFARIAQRAGLSSTRLISYHFAGKQELMEQVAGELFTEIGAFVAQRLAGQTTAAGALRAYIEANLDYIAEHRTQMKALLGIFLSGALSADPGVNELVSLLPVEQILSDGQRSGEFRPFDTTVIATSIQRSFDGIPLLLESRPDLDLASCARELVTMFDLATRRTV